MKKMGYHAELAWITIRLAPLLTLSILFILIFLMVMEIRLGIKIIAHPFHRGPNLVFVRRDLA